MLFSFFLFPCTFRRWWFASTAIPLLAATIGPLSNVLSIAALVTPWRVTLPNDGALPEGIDDAGVGITDPKWYVCLRLSSPSLRDYEVSPGS
jgi:potassium channel subfamily K